MAGVAAAALQDKTAWMEQRYRDQYGDDREPTFAESVAATANAGGEQGEELPPWDGIKATDPPPRKPVLIPGMLRKGHVAVFSGKGKVGKTASMTELAIATATNGEWFGRKIENGGMVLHLDPEVDPLDLHNRYSEACKRMGADPRIVDERVKKWSLRGDPNSSMERVIAALKRHAAFGEFGLVIIDSASSFVTGDENSSVDVRRFGASAFQVAAITGASVVCVHHFGKAKDGDRSSVDRARGSSVWLDFPDGAFTITETFPPSGEPSDYLDDGQSALILEGVCRSFPPFEPSRLLFKYPLHALDLDGVTEGWKARSSQSGAGRQSGGVRRAQAEADRLRDEALISSYFIRNGIGKDGVPVSEIAREVFGQDRPDRVKHVVESSATFGLFKPARNRLNVVPIEPPPEKPEEPPKLDLGSG